MNVITMGEAQRNLEQLIRQTVDDVEPTIVVAPDGAKAVFVSLHACLICIVPSRKRAGELSERSLIVP